MGVREIDVTGLNTEEIEDVLQCARGLPPSQRFFWRYEKFWNIAAVVCIIIVMLGVGVGIAVAGRTGTRMEVRNSTGVVKAYIQSRSDGKDGIEVTNRAGVVLQRIP